MFKLEKKIQTLVTYSNDVIYVLFRGEGSGKGNSKDLGRGDPFNAGKQRRKGSIRKAWTMKDYFLYAYTLSHISPVCSVEHK